MKKTVAALSSHIAQLFMLHIKWEGSNHPGISCFPEGESETGVYTVQGK